MSITTIWTVNISAKTVSLTDISSVKKLMLGVLRSKSRGRVVLSSPLSLSTK